MQVISIKNVYVSREDKEILKNVAWNVKKREHWALIGLNGAGKTTLLKMVNGFVWPKAHTGAEIEVLGKKFGTFDLRELRKSIGWVSSSLAESISPSHSVFEVVLSGKFATLGIYDEVMDEDKERVKKIMQELGIEDLAGKRYGVCSQGEKQKVMIARALMASPKLLILDEPCNGLDICSREKLLSTIEWLGQKEDGPTLIYVTHHIEEICPAITHALLIKDGEVIASGPKHEVIRDDLLSDGLGVPLEVHWKAGRPWIQLPSLT